MSNEERRISDPFRGKRGLTLRFKAGGNEVINMVGVMALVATWIEITKEKPDIKPAVVEIIGPYARIDHDSKELLVEFAEGLYSKVWSTTPMAMIPDP